MNYNTSCNSDCHCDFVKYAPVCGEDQRTYISACHAGCSERRSSGLTNNLTTPDTVFDNCSCIPGLSNATEWGSATPGSCPINCDKEFHIFLFVFCLGTIITATGSTSNYLINLRCVPEEDKSVAMSLGMSLKCLLGYMPIALIIGKLFDEACVLWGNTCSSSGNCWIYDGYKLR